MNEFNFEVEEETVEEIAAHEPETPLEKALETMISMVLRWGFPRPLPAAIGGWHKEEEDGRSLVCESHPHR
jgi:hypothetical protein